MNMDECSVGDSSVDPLLLESTECLVFVRVRKIPDHFPYAPGTHPTQHSSRTGFEHSSETVSYPLEIIDAIQGAKIRESAVE
jgi:hypothetical protein